MSNREVIEWLKKKAEVVTMPGARKMYQAAAKALEAQNVVEKALDEYEYNGKTLREWIEIISASEHGTNLAEVGTDCISRAEAIEVIERARAHIGHNMERAVGRVFLEMLDDVGLSISKLPPIQPKRGKWIEIEAFSDCRYVKCDQCKTVEVFYYGKRNTNFCPNCGAKMEVSDGRD